MIGYFCGSLAMAFSPWLLPRFLCLALTVLAIALLYRGQRLVCGVMVALAVCSLRGDMLLQRQLPEICNRQPLLITGEVSSLPRVTDMGEGGRRQRFELSVQHIDRPAGAAPRRVLLSYYGDETIEPGQWWRLPVSLRRPWGLSNPGSFNLQAWYALSGIHAIGSVRGT